MIESACPQRAEKGISYSPRLVNCMLQASEFCSLLPRWASEFFGGIEIIEL